MERQGHEPGTGDNEWLQKFLQHRIGDQRRARLIGKWLKAGDMESDHWQMRPCRDLCGWHLRFGDCRLLVGGCRAN